LNKTLSMIGLCQKAGKISSGEFSVETAIKAGHAHLVIIADNASDNTKKKFTNMCNYRQIPYKIDFDKDELGHAIGKQFRATICVTDEQFATSIEKTWR